MHSLRFAPLVLAVLLGSGIVVRIWFQWRRHGTPGVVLFRSGRPAQTLRDALYLVLAAVLGAISLLSAWNPDWLRFGALPGFDAAAPRVAGAVAAFAGSALMMHSTLRMGASWRIGIEDGARPGLVTTGVYRFCRHPIYLFLLVALAGFVLMLPHVVTLGAWIGAWAGFRSQAAAEEAYLERTYGEEYRSWAARTGRFLPGIGARR